MTTSENNVQKPCVAMVPIFNQLTVQEMQELAKVSVKKTYYKGSMIVIAGKQYNNLFIIHKGCVKNYRVTETGKEQILRLLGPGEFIGELSIFGGTPVTSYAEAMEETEICTIHQNAMNSLMLRKPEIALKIIEELSQRLEQAEILIEQISCHDLDKRVAYLLLELMDKYVKSEEKEQTIALNLNKKELASLIGTSRESLSRKLSQFQDQGYIKLIGPKEIIILQEQQLKELVK